MKLLMLYMIRIAQQLLCSYKHCIAYLLHWAKAQRAHLLSQTLSAGVYSIHCLAQPEQQPALRLVPQCSPPDQLHTASEIKGERTLGRDQDVLGHSEWSER